MPITHAHVSAAPDNPAHEISSSEWNDDHDIALDDADIPAGITRDSELTAAITAHSDDTTAVHGIADTSALATDAEVATAVSDHVTAAHAGLATDAEVVAAVSDHVTAAHAGLATDAEVATAVSDHNADTTSVHGIADTSALATDGDVATAVSDHVTAAHAGLATDAEVATAVSDHAAAADPHAGYRKESDDHTHASSGAQGGTIAHSALTGLTAGDPHTQYQQESEKGAASGYASLDASTKVPIAQLPTGTAGTEVALGNHGHTLDFGESGDIVAVAFGDTAAAGATGEIADAGHRHAAPANPVTAHEAAADPHTGYLKENDPNWVDLTDGGATTLHSHAGGGSSPWTYIIKGADTSRVNNTVSADPDLQVALSANTNYLIRLRVMMDTNATPDARYQLTFSGTTTRVRRLVKRTATTDTAMTIERKTSFDAAAVVLSTTGTGPWVEEEILLQVGASGGTLAFQWAQNTTNAAACTVLEGSSLEYAVT